MAKINDQKAPAAQETLNKSEALLVKYSKPVIIAVVAIVIVILGVVLSKNYYFEPREQEASTALAKGQEYFQAQQWDKALKGDGAGFTGLLKIVENYGCTDAANLANLYIGLTYANQNKWQEAVKYLEEFSPKSDIMISPASQAALGNAYANLKQYDKAVDYLKKAASMADSQSETGANASIAPSALLQAGEILENQNKKDEALKIYEEIKAKYVNSPVAGEIDKYIERAK